MSTPSGVGTATVTPRTTKSTYGVTGRRRVSALLPAVSSALTSMFCFQKRLLRRLRAWPNGFWATPRLFASDMRLNGSWSTAQRSHSLGLNTRLSRCWASGSSSLRTGYTPTRASPMSGPSRPWPISRRTSCQPLQRPRRVSLPSKPMNSYLRRSDPRPWWPGTPLSKNRSHCQNNGEPLRRSKMPYSTFQTLIWITTAGFGLGSPLRVRLEMRAGRFLMRGQLPQERTTRSSRQRHGVALRRIGLGLERSISLPLITAGSLPPRFA